MSFKRTPLNIPEVELVSLPDEEDWLLRPVLENLIKAESLDDTRYDLAWVAKLNDALDVKYENSARIQAAMQRR